MTEKPRLKKIKSCLKTWKEYETFLMVILTAIMAFSTVYANWLSKEALDKTLQVSATALNASIATSRLDQRAWIGTTDITNINFTVGSKTTIEFILTNTGKSPALKVTGKADAIFLPKDKEFNPVYHELSTKPSISVIQPGSRGRISISSPGVLTKKGADAIRSGDIILYFFGEYYYDDIFKQTHHSTFCMYLKDDLKSTLDCPFYNDAN